MHRHSPYDCGRTRFWQCRFGYDTNDVSPETLLYKTCIRRIDTQKSQEGSNVVPKHRCLRREYLVPIKVERTQGGGSVAHLMKYAFKQQSMQNVQLSQDNNLRQTGLQKNLQIHQIPLDTASAMTVFYVCQLEWEKQWKQHENFLSLDPSEWDNILCLHDPFENARNLINWTPPLPQSLEDSPLNRYLKRPTAYRSFTLMHYMEKVRLYRCSLVVLKVNKKALLEVLGILSIMLFSSEKSRKIIELQGFASYILLKYNCFSLWQILLGRNVSSFQNERTWEPSFYTTFNAPLLQWDFMHTKKIVQVLWWSCTYVCSSRQRKSMLVCLCQIGASSRWIALKAWILHVVWHTRAHNKWKAYRAPAPSLSGFWWAPKSSFAGPFLLQGPLRCLYKR